MLYLEDSPIKGPHESLQSTSGLPRCDAQVVALADDGACPKLVKTIYQAQSIAKLYASSMGCHDAWNDAASGKFTLLKN